MADKDFLSQFSEVGKKPESFQEETRVKIQKERKPVNKLALIIVLVVLVIIGIVSYFVFFAPKIEMPNFVGKTKNDVAAFVKQQEIETTGIIFEEEYNFDNDEDVILSQSIEAGKKIKNDAKINFVISLGPDPDETIKFPDLESMDKTEIKEWIDDNKLTKTKITTSYSESVDIDQVISYSLTGADEDSFTRSSNLKISISKGPAPAGTIQLEDFVKKAYEYVDTWATSKKVKLVKTEAYSDTVDKGLVISQSIASNKTMKEGDTLSIVVSKGKGILLPDFTTMSKKDVDNWLTNNKDFTVTIANSKYSDSSSYIIEQSVKAGVKVGIGDPVNLTKNLGDGFYLSEEGVDLTGSYDKVKDWEESSSEKGLDIYVYKNYVNSDKPKGTIISYKISKGSKTYSAIQKLPLSVVINCEVSNGEEYIPPVTIKTVGNYIGMNVDAAESQVLSDGFACIIEKLYNENSIDNVYKQSPQSGKEFVEGSEVELYVSLGKRFKLTDLFSENNIIGNNFDGVYQLVNEASLDSKQFNYIAESGDSGTVTKDDVIKNFKCKYNGILYDRNENIVLSNMDLGTLNSEGKIDIYLVLFSK